MDKDLIFNKKSWRSTIKRPLLIILGCTSLSLGFVGIFLPVLPTTPFLLLSSACFLRSSDSLYHWITHHRLFGSYIRNYLNHRAISVRAKGISLFSLWAVILCTVIFFSEQLWLRILLIAMAVGVSIYLLSIRTLTKEMLEESEAER